MKTFIYPAGKCCNEVTYNQMKSLLDPERFCPLDDRMMDHAIARNDSIKYCSRLGCKKPFAVDAEAIRQGLCTWTLCYSCMDSDDTTAAAADSADGG